MGDSNDGRTHEPSLRELTAELDGLREVVAEKLRGLKELIDERDKRYTERDRDRQLEVEKALTASKELTNQAFAASREAIAEAKKSQDAYNTTHNDLVRKMERQGAETMTRADTEARIHILDEKIQDLKTGAGTAAGSVYGGRLVKDETRANLAILISVLSFLALMYFRTK